MENYSEKAAVLESYIQNLCNSSKFRRLNSNIAKLQKKYLAKGLTHDEVVKKITGKLFNDNRSANVNWMNPKNTFEYHKIKNLGNFDSATIEVAIALNQELLRAKKLLKAPSQTLVEETVDQASDFFQCKLDEYSNEKESSSGSDSPYQLEMQLSKGDSLYKSERLSRSVSQESSASFNMASGTQGIRSSNLVRRRMSSKPIEQEISDWEYKSKKIKFMNLPRADPGQSTLNFTFKDISEEISIEMAEESAPLGNCLKRKRDVNDQISIEKDNLRFKYM